MALEFKQLKGFPQATAALQILATVCVLLLAIESLVADAITSQRWFIGIERAMLGISVFVWIGRDAESKEMHSGMTFAILSVFLPELVTPVYLFWSRGFKGGVIAIVKVLAFILIAVSLAAAISVAADHGLIPKIVIGTK